MKTKKIKEHNSQIFLDDLNKATSFLAYAEKTGYYYTITKKSLIYSAETKHVDYFMSENLGSLGFTMVVR